MQDEDKDIYNFPVPRILALIFLAACAVEPPGMKPETTAKKSQVTPVTVAVIAAKEVPWVVETTGVTEPSDRFQAKAPEGGGKITELFVEIGQRVNAGDPLVKFEEEEIRLKLEVARSQQQEAEAGLEEVRYNQTNRERLLEEEKLTEVEAQGLDEKKALFEATIDRARDEIDLYETQLENLQLNSPIPGLVTQRQVSLGSALGEGELLLEIVRIDPLRFSFFVPLEVAATLERGGSIPVRFPTIAPREVPGEILAIGTEAGQEGEVKISLNLPNETFALKAEMKGTIHFNTPLRKKIMTIPPQALIKTERSVYAFRIEGEKATSR